MTSNATQCKQRYYESIAAGKCPRCNKREPASGKRLCDVCSVRYNKLRQLRRVTLRARKICANCHSRPAREI